MAIRIDEYGHIIRDDNSTNNSNVPVHNSGDNQFRAPNANASNSYSINSHSTPRSTTPILEINPAIPNSILILGIVSLVSAGTYYFSIIGVICAIIGLVKASRFANTNGQLVGKAKVGRNLCIGGLIASIVLTGYLIMLYLHAISAY